MLTANRDNMTSAREGTCVVPALRPLFAERDDPAPQRRTAVIRDLDNSGGYTAGDIRTRYDYDATGRQESVTDARGHTTYFEYDEQGRQTAVISALTQDPDDPTRQVRLRTEYGYDDRGRRVEVRENIKQYTDANGDTQIDRTAQRITNQEHNDAGQLTAVTLPHVDSNNLTSVRPTYNYTYDQWGNRTSITDPNGNETRFTFDHAGRQLTRTLPLGVIDGTGFIESFQYNNATGQLILHTDFEGRVTEHVYDNSPAGGGRLTEKIFYASTANFDTGTISEHVTYRYDAFGRRIETAQHRPDGTTDTTTYAYEAEGRATHSACPQGTINYEYDDLGRKTRTYTDNTDIRYTHDLLGRLLTVGVYKRGDASLDDPNTPEIESEMTIYDYDLVGNLDEIEQSNGVIADYHYDALNRLELLEHYKDDNNDGVIQDHEVRALYEYELNLDGARAKVIETNDLGEETSITWTYDGLNRLIKEEYDRGNDGPSAGGYTTSYAYDSAGNRLQKSTDNYSDNNLDGNADEIITYVYDANDRLLKEEHDSNGDSVTNKTTTYDYSVTEQTNKTVWEGTDTSGTGTKISETTYEYNLQGRMSKVAIDSNGDGTIDTTTTYTYNDNGIRVEQSVTENGTTTTIEYLIDPRNFTGYAQILETYVNDVLAKTFTLGHDAIAQHDATNGALTFLYDGHGSTRALIDAAAQIIQRFAYDAYGVMLSGTNLTLAADALTTLLYSGEWTNSSGQQYLRARWYDPATGRFTRMDPFSGLMNEPQSLHKYLFGHGNPVVYTDPSGQLALLTGLAATGIITMLIGGGMWYFGEGHTSSIGASIFAFGGVLTASAALFPISLTMGTSALVLGALGFGMEYNILGMGDSIREFARGDIDPSEDFRHFFTGAVMGPGNMNRTFPRDGLIIARGFDSYPDLTDLANVPRFNDQLPMLRTGDIIYRYWIFNEKLGELAVSTSIVGENGIPQMIDYSALTVRSLFGLFFEKLKYRPIPPSIMITPSDMY